MWVLVKWCSYIISWRYWMQLFLVDNLFRVYQSVSGTLGCLFWNNQNVRLGVRDCKQYKVYLWLLCFFPTFLFIPSFSVPHLLAGRWEMSLWYETLFIEWSDLFCLHAIHLFSPPWQFSLGTWFNIGQNAICIYISFFIRPGSLSPLKTLRIWWESVAANLK